MLFRVCPIHEDTCPALPNSAKVLVSYIYLNKAARGSWAVEMEFLTVFSQGDRAPLDRGRAESFRGNRTSRVIKSHPLAW